MDFSTFNGLGTAAPSTMGWNNASNFSFGNNNASAMPYSTGSDYLSRNYAQPDMSTFNGDSSQFNWAGGYGKGGNDSTAGLNQTGQLGMNIPTFQLGLSGLSAIGNLWGAFQSQKLASDQFDFAKNMANKNLANQTASYNTALSDRATSRGSMEGWTESQTQDYINKNKLSN